MMEMSSKIVPNLFIFLYKSLDTYLLMHPEQIRQNFTVHWGLSESTRNYRGPQRSMSDYSNLLRSTDNRKFFVTTQLERTSVSLSVAPTSRES